MSWLVVGVDPGKKGGISLLHTGQVIWACDYAVESDHITVRYMTDRKGLKRYSLPNLSYLCQRCVLPYVKHHNFVIAVEGLRYIPGRPGIIDCAEIAGQFIGNLAHHAFGVYRPMSYEWRREILGAGERIGNKKLDKACKQKMARYDLGCLQNNIGVCDATAIAEWTQKRVNLENRYKAAL